MKTGVKKSLQAGQNSRSILHPNLFHYQGHRNYLQDKRVGMPRCLTSDFSSGSFSLLSQWFPKGSVPRIFLHWVVYTEPCRPYIERVLTDFKEQFWADSIFTLLITRQCVTHHFSFVEENVYLCDWRRVRASQLRLRVQNPFGSRLTGEWEASRGVPQPCLAVWCCLLTSQVRGTLSGPAIESSAQSCHQALLLDVLTPGPFPRLKYPSHNKKPW